MNDDGFIHSSSFSFLKDEVVMRLLDILRDAGIEGRFVGGCVRDALLGVPIHDIDIAVDAPILQVVALLQKHQIKVIPTGLAHGTVTAFMDHRSIELTSLREDIQTYGRHAKIVPTQEWATDAQRRDFTVNALYVDDKGKLYDFVGGLADIRDKKIRFIGDPAERIREDYLRILRFFRFSSAYAQGTFDESALAACRENREGLKRISRERKTEELFKLLQTPHALDAWNALENCAILTLLFEKSFSYSSYNHLVQWEKKYEISSSPLRVCAVLPLSIPELERTFVFSKVQKNLISYLKEETDLLNKDTLFKSIYNYGKTWTKEKIIFQSAQDNLDPFALIVDVDYMSIPQFPLKGKDLMTLGYLSGPLIGQILKKVESWWIHHQGKPSYEECIEFVRKKNFLIRLSDDTNF